MELIGEEKRIQALFSEARLADEQITPSFAGVWNRAQAKTIRSHRAFNFSFVAATALLVCALVSLAWWSRHWQRSPEVIASAPTSATVPAPSSANTGGEIKERDSSPPVGRHVSFRPKSNAVQLAARHEAALLLAANKRATNDAKAIASWKSPTATLLDSSNGELLKSLPQLNQTVDELKSFLPNQPK